MCARDSMSGTLPSCQSSSKNVQVLDQPLPSAIRPSVVQAPSDVKSLFSRLLLGSPRFGIPNVVADESTSPDVSVSIICGVRCYRLAWSRINDDSEVLVIRR